MSAPWPIVGLLTVLGLAIGSFLNVVIHRVPRGESVISPGSHCPRCDTPIKGRHNVPVLGWLVLRGRCAQCQLGISPRYPLVEAATGGLFAAITIRFGLSAELPAFLFLAAVAITLAMIDVDLRALPNRLVVSACVAGAVLLAVAGVLDAEGAGLVRAAIGAAAAVLALLAVRRFGPNRLHPGAGTVELAGLLGLYLAWVSWTTLLVGVAVTVVAAGITAGVAVVAERALPISSRAAPLRITSGGITSGGITSGGITSGGIAVATLPLAACLLAASLLSVLVATPFGH